MLESKIILATGANGAIGKEVQKIALKDYIKFIPTSRQSEGELHLDVTDLEETQDKISYHKPDIIFHLASIVPIPLIEKDPDKAFLINVLGLNNVFRAVEKYSTSCKVIVVSSSEIYGSSSTVNKFVETDSFNPNNFYAFTKVAQEELALLYLKRGLDIKIARVFNYSSIYKEPIYSLESFTNQIANLIKDNGEKIIKVGNLLPERDFLQGADVAKALFKIALAKESEVIYNVCRGEVISMHSLLEKIIKAFKVEIQIFKDESKFRLIDNMYVCGDNSKLRKLGWEPEISIDEMINTLVDHYKEKLIA